MCLQTFLSHMWFRAALVPPDGKKPPWMWQPRPHQISAIANQFYTWFQPLALNYLAPPLQLSLSISIYIVWAGNTAPGSQMPQDKRRVEHLLTSREAGKKTNCGSEHQGGRAHHKLRSDVTLNYQSCPRLLTGKVHLMGRTREQDQAHVTRTDIYIRHMCSCMFLYTNSVTGEGVGRVKSQRSACRYGARDRSTTFKDIVEERVRQIDDIVNHNS